MALDFAAGCLGGKKIGFNIYLNAILYVLNIRGISIIKQMISRF